MAGGLKQAWQLLSGAEKLGVVGTGIGAATNLAKGIFGAIQSSRGSKEMRRLLDHPVTYKRPEEYAKELALRQQEMNGNLPGYGIMKDNIDQAGATARLASEKGAISSNVYQRSVGDIFQKTLQAYQDLGLQSAQWKDQQKDKYAQTLEKGANYSDAEWTQNKLVPYEQRLNLASEERQAGFENLFGGIEGIGATVNNLAGTRYYQDIMKKLRGTV